MPRGGAVLGLRTHSGWAALVAVAGDKDRPAVVERRRIEMADGRLRGSVQPYHEAEEMALPQAERLLGRLRESARSLARAQLGQVMADLAARGQTPRAAVILHGAGRLGRTLADTLRSHAMIHTADGEHFRDALAQASEALGLNVVRVPEREVPSLAAAVLSGTPAEVQGRVAAMGKALGPPWTADQKCATLAAWTVLAGGALRR
jgi:hypothetical protein